jgi:hypothetical protein
MLKFTLVLHKNKQTVKFIANTGCFKTEFAINLSYKQSPNSPSLLKRCRYRLKLIEIILMCDIYTRILLKYRSYCLRHGT